MGKIMRYQIADYLGITTTSESTTTTTYYLMGTGFTKVDESPNAQVETVGYINDRSKSSTVIGYERSFAFDSDFIKEQEAIDALYKVARDAKTGSDAEFEYVRVDLYDEVAGSGGTPSGEYKARKFKVAAEVSSVTGAGTEKVAFSGVLHGIGDPVQGKFKVSDKTFTADT